MRGINGKRNKAIHNIINPALLFKITLLYTLSGCLNVSKVVAQEGGTELSGKFVKVAILQINPIGANVDENLKKGDEYCRKAKSLGADIALFPEMWSNGYSFYHWPGSVYTPDKYPLNFEDWKAKAVDSDSEFMVHFQKLAVELDMSIVITYLEKWNGLPRNSATVIDSKGNILMTYAKVHTSDMHVFESNCTPGDDFYVCDLPIRSDTVKIGIMTCFDREFPESARILMLKGAELILTPNACGIRDKRINLFQARAIENVVGVAMYPLLDTSSVVHLRSSPLSIPDFTHGETFS